MGREKPQEPVSALRPPSPIARDRGQAVEDALEEAPTSVMVFLKGVGHLGRRGAVAVGRVGREPPQELVRALRLPIMVPVKEQVQIIKDALEGIVQVLILISRVF